MTTRRLAWDWIGRPGHENLTLVATPDGIIAEGDIAAALDATPFRLRYRLVCDPEWRFRSAFLSLDGLESRTCRIARTTAGAWSVNEMPRRDFAGASAIDIMATPFTNTLPIRTLPFVRDAPVRVDVAYIAVPSLAVTLQSQEYTPLSSGISPGRFRYHGLATGFTAELEVDSDGIVLRYGDVWCRA
jgi:uncharacterized protein